MNPRAVMAFRQKVIPSTFAEPVLEHGYQLAHARYQEIREYPSQLAYSTSSASGAHRVARHNTAAFAPYKRTKSNKFTCSHAIPSIPS
jgi:hypothetical protein